MFLPEAEHQFICHGACERIDRTCDGLPVVGYSVHFAGTAGTGKTTLAFHAAAKLGRPVILVHGDDEFGSSDWLVGTPVIVNPN